MADGHLAARQPALRRGKLGTGEVLFQSIGQISPAGGIAVVAIVAASFAGGAFPLATVISVVGCLFVALSVSQLAKHLPSAGSLGTYITQALGGGVGLVTGWMYAISELLIVSFVALLIGDLVAGVGNAEFGWPITATWVITAIAVYVLVTIVHELGIGVSARVQQVISIIEILLFLALSITLIAKAGDRNTLSVFGTTHANIAGYHGAAGLFPAAVFIITAFAGFETAASLAEEAREPRKAVSTAVIAAVVSIGVLYLITSYAATVFFGPGHMGAFAAFNGGDPWTGMTRGVWGVGWVALFFIIVNSLYSCTNATTNVSTRMMFSLGRSGLGPRSLSFLGRRQTPSRALAVVVLVGLILALWLGVQYGPVTGFSIMAVTSTSMYISLYILVNISCLVYFVRNRRHELNWLLHIVVPVIGAAVFIPVLLDELGIPVFSFVAKLTTPLIYGAYAAFAIVFLLVIAAIVVWRRSPENLRQLGAVFDQVGLRDDSIPSPPVPIPEAALD